MLLIHRRDIIEPVEIRDRLQIGLLLDQLFGAAMQQADMRIDALDDLAVEFEHQTQHAMRRRMLRPEIDREVSFAGGLGHVSCYPLASSPPGANCANTSAPVMLCVLLAKS